MTSTTLLTIIITVIVGYTAIQLFVFKKLRKLAKHIKSLRTVQKSSSQELSALSELELQINEWSEERKEEIEQLKKLENYRKEYLGNVSHELKTPIFNIQGYVATLLDGGLEDKTINRSYLERAMKSVDRMILILEDLQAITQLEKGELEMEEERFDILTLIHDVIDAQEMKAREKKIMLSLSNDSSQPIFVWADKFRIRQALVNLVVNSVRYGKENGKTTIKISDTGEKVIVEVADTGIGIAKEHLPRIFERFYRADKSRSRDQGGTGLGLSIVKHILEAHGQTISVISTEGAGSVFSFTLKKG
ncbi:MAG TPA: ATP-binding protein [Bacteroidia bacterium]|nr:ATP-binding protein [Bacteroidia bacterium]